MSEPDQDAAQLRQTLLSRKTLLTSEVQALLRLNSPAAARVQMARWRIKAVSRDKTTGEKRWPTKEVESHNRDRAGRGARTDLAAVPDPASDPD
jgi:hypothetical protein